LDPQLEPLADKGGPTQTHAFQQDSPAFNGGSNALAPVNSTTEQRGKARISGTTVDIGAFELQLLLSIAGGNNQSTTVDTGFDDDLQVKVIDEFDNVVPNVTVTLTSPTTGASTSLKNTTLTTNANGTATTTANANTVAGTYQVEATSTGITGVNFNLTNNPGAANSLTILAGNNQNTTVNTAFTDSLQVQVTDKFGNVVPDVTVTLTPPTTGPGASLDSISLTTDVSGIATTIATANTIAGNYQLAATSTGITGVDFNLTNDPGAAAILNILTGNNQSTDVNTAFADSLQIQVTDEFGNVVPGVTVTFTAPATGASASIGSITLTTNTAGLASTTVTANSMGGNYQVGARVIGVTEVNFDLANIAAPVIVPGDFTSVIVPDDFTSVIVPGDSTLVTVPGDSTLVIVPGDSTLVVVRSDSTPLVVPANSTPVIVPGNSTPILVRGDATTSNIPDFTLIWQSVIEELPESGLEEFACQTAPAIVINFTEEEGEITLDEEIKTEIQRNQDCQPVANQGNE
ncbi:MAG: hypothetical protein F6K41_28015, partial [Symploca sp. SIO3E6]|nr:hypothetical protein [Caldora sp. SIO3E6]